MFSNMNVKVKVTQSCLTLCDPMDCILQARILEWAAFPFSKGSSQPRDQTQVSYIAGGFFTSWAIREAQNTGVGSLSLLQWIFLTQESNWGLLCCRQILYQLSYQGSLVIWMIIFYWLKALCYYVGINCHNFCYLPRLVIQLLCVTWV